MSHVYREQFGDTIRIDTPEKIFFCSCTGGRGYLRRRKRITGIGGERFESVRGE
jgi:hypothetical protein